MSKLEFISATRHPASEVANTALGRSLRRLTKAMPFDAHITAENTTGLPQLYNARIGQGPDESILVFVHDDVWVEDFAIDAALADALNRFDIVGVVGNQRRVPGRPTWSGGTEHRDGSLDFPYLSGRVGHSKTPFGKILNLGPLKVPCQMIDGLFIAVRRGTLRRAGVQFDPQFSFHFYDGLLPLRNTSRSQHRHLAYFPHPPEFGEIRHTLGARPRPLFCQMGRLSPRLRRHAEY